MQLLTLFLIFGLLSGVVSCEQTPISVGTSSSSGSLEVTHTPLSLNDVPKELIDKLKFPYVRFYRTDVKNNTEKPIRIVWFEGSFNVDGRWIATNVRNKVLRTKDFMDWYSREDMTADGWLRPGGTASCHVNWHWTETPEDVQTKWTYIGVDGKGNDYFAEAIVPEIKPEKMK